jgi:hypothetical protein
MGAMPRPHGTGRIYTKWGSYYGRWRTVDGRYVNRRLGNMRARGEKEGLSRREAERVLRRLIEAQSLRPAPTPDEQPRTVDEAADALRERIARCAQRYDLRSGYGSSAASPPRIVS